MSTEVVDARKALVKAIWSCIVDASSMNVVLSGPEVNAAMDGYRAAVLRELREEVAGMPCCSFVPGGRRRVHDLGCWGSALRTVLAAIDRRLGE
jgi:hypothetical protein